LGCGVPGSRSIALHRGKPSKSQRLEVKAHRGLVVRGSCLYPGCQTDSSTRQIQQVERGKIMTERSAAGRNRCRHRRQSHQISNQLQPCYRGPAVQGSMSKGPSPRACVGGCASQCAVLGRQNSDRIWGVGARAPAFGVEGSVLREEILRKRRKVSKYPNRAMDPRRNCIFPHPRAFAVSGLEGMQHYRHHEGRGRAMGAFMQATPPSEGVRSGVGWSSGGLRQKP
jgi:hypothetical protein